MPAAKFKQEVFPSQQNLLRLCQIRSIVIIGLMVILFAFWFFGIVLSPPFAVFVVLAVVATINVLIFLRLRFGGRVTGDEFFFNLLLDVIFLTLVLYFTGGSTNPIVSYYLIPIIISAAVLRPIHTWLIAFLSIVFYSVLLVYYQPFAPFTISGHGAMTNAHLVGMWINFGFSALLISWFVVRMAQTLREKYRDISLSREAGLRNEQIISVASIAAGTAHEMRTPLATMALTVDEIGDEHPELKQDMLVLEQQIERCDTVLRELVSTTTEDSRMVVTSFKVLSNKLLHKWRLTRPEVRLEASFPDNVSMLKIRYDQSLQHALMSFLNNAADASPDFVAIRAELTDGFLLITIKDHGPGIPVEIADSLGKKYVSRKRGGLGLGVLLSQASIERLGGAVTLKDMPGKGTRLEIQFPLVEGEEGG